MAITIKNPGGQIVGVDIGSNFIKVCQAQVRGGRPEVTALALLPTPSDAVSGTEIIDPVALGKALKQLLLQSGFKSRKVVTSVAGQSSLVVRIIEVPKMTAKELQETMKWEVERHVPFAAEQTVMDFQPLSTPDEVPDGQNMEVLLAVAQEGMINKHIAALQAAGLTPKAIDIEPLAASRSLVALGGNGDPSGTVAVVDVGANTTDISIFRDGRITFTRSIQIAGNTMTKAISDVIGQPLPQAERMKKEFGAAPDSGVGEDAGAQTVDLGGIDFGVPQGETLSFDMPGDAPTSTFDVAGGDIGASPFTEAASPFDAPGGAANPLASPAPAPAAGEDIFGAPPAADVFGTPSAGDLLGSAPAADPLGGLEAGPQPAASPFDAPLDLSGPAVLPVPAAPATPAPSAAAPADGDEYVRQQVADAITPVLMELVTELQRSLDFYRNRANGQGVQRIVVFGGTAKLPGLDRFLAANLATPVALGNVLESIGVTAPLDPDYLKEIAPLFPVSIGLAMRDMLVEAPPPRARGKGKKQAAAA